MYVPFRLIAILTSRSPPSLPALLGSHMGSEIIPMSLRHLCRIFDHMTIPALGPISFPPVEMVEATIDHIGRMEVNGGQHALFQKYDTHRLQGYATRDAYCHE
jgi:hypothetical protein